MRRFFSTCGALPLLYIILLPGSLEAGSILNYPAGVRQAAMGGAAAALSGDSGSAAFNPATAAGIPGTRVSLMYDSSYLDTSVYYASVFTPVLGGVIGAGILWYDGGTLRINAPDDPGMHGKRVRAQSDYLGTLTASGRITGRIDAGVSIKYYSSTLIEEYSADTLTADAGLIWHTPLFSFGAETIPGRPYSPGVALGGSVRNIAGELKYDRVSEEIEILSGGGICYAVRVTPEDEGVFTADLVYTERNGAVPYFGAEYAHRGMLFLRAGYRTSEGLDGFSLGFGLTYENFALDYALMPDSTISRRHLFLIGVGL